MKQLGFYFLAFATFWVSTWMVTDIHDLSMLKHAQPHPIFSLQSSVDHALEKKQFDEEQHFSYCRDVCSYDHGGHLGQTLLPSPVLHRFVATQSRLFSRYAYTWHFQVTPPKNRPPIVV